MGLRSQINDDLKTAMLGGDRLRVDTLKMLKSSMGYAEVESGKRDEGLNDDEILQIIAKEVKKRSESIEMYKKAGALDRAATEESELNILKSYLPEQLTGEQLNSIVSNILEQNHNFSSGDIGKVIGLVKLKAGAMADGARIAAAVKKRLSR